MIGRYFYVFFLLDVRFSSKGGYYIGIWIAKKNITSC